MTDDVRARVDGSVRDPARPDTTPGDAPAPLSSIRVKGPRPRGLNKPAIIAAAGGGVLVVLILASGAFSTDPSARPATARPVMSGPARPEMAKGAVRDLPATYAEAQAFRAASQLADPSARQDASHPYPSPPDPSEFGPPQLGPPLPGDIAAFAPEGAHSPEPQQAAWDVPNAYPPPAGPSPAAKDPATIEAAQAERSGLFFDLREAPAASALQPDQGVQASPTNSIVTLAWPTNDRPSDTPVTNGTLHPGAVISASLVTAINSESPGAVIAQVTQSIHDSATGRTLLIPQGARLIGDYRSVAKYGQSRLAIAWSRLIMPDGSEIALDEAAVDPSGAAGVAGKIDNHWGDVFGAAALGTLINIGVATTQDPQLTHGGIGIVSRDPVKDAIADGVQRGASLVANRTVDRSLAIPPTIRIEAGARVSVIVSRRISF